MLFCKEIFGWRNEGGGFAANYPRKDFFSKKGYLVKVKGRSLSLFNNIDFLKEVMALFQANQKALADEFNKNLEIFKTTDMTDKREKGGGDRFFVLNGKKVQTNYGGLTLNVMHEFYKNFNEIFNKYYPNQK